MKLLTHRWMVIALCGGLTASAFSAGTDGSGKKLNPYHVNELNKQIQKSAAEVLACKDDESRCMSQQELCKKLIQVEKYDEALELARNIHLTDNINAERRAVHHYLIAEIYARKMRSASDMSTLESNHGLALQTAREVTSRNYPSKWGVTDQAKNLIAELQSPEFFQNAQIRLSGNSGALNQSREAMANAQTAYMERAVSQKAGPVSRTVGVAKNAGGSFFQGISSKVSKRKIEPEKSVVAANPASMGVTRKRTAPARETTIKAPYGLVSNDNSSPLRYPGSAAAPAPSSPVQFENGDKVTFSQNASRLVSNGPTALSPVNAQRPATTSQVAAVQQLAPAQLADRAQSASKNSNSLLSGRPTGSRPGETYASGQVPAKGRI